VQVLLLTEIGYRVEVPEYGVRPMMFATVDSVAVVEACSRWEPRAEVSIESAVGETWDDLVTSVVANVRSTT
jgi:phage baseplate assembly protein W